MLFWAVSAILTIAVAAIVARPLLQNMQAQADTPDVAIYKAQLAEVDRDLAREVLAPEEAERARAEIARRLLAASKEGEAKGMRSGPTRTLAVIVGLVLLAGSLLLYREIGAPGYPDLPLAERLANSAEVRANRPDQAALETAAPTPPPVDASEDYIASIAQLRSIAPTRPDDQELFRLLALHEAQLRNYGAAADAQERLIALKGDGATAADKERLLDLLVVAAGGIVSPEAELVARDILETDADNRAALYYIGALYNQTDRPDLALRFWRLIIEGGDPENFHVASARAQAADAAFRAGVEYVLPEVRGPSADDIDAAQDMTAEDRQQMIGGMVSRLAERLATEGGTAEDWARLIRAYGVLGDKEAAATVWAEAQQVFVSSFRGMETLRAAARAAGVLEE